MVDNYDLPVQPSNSGMFFDPDDDHSFVGERYWHGTAGEGLTIMDLVALQADGFWDQADADVEAETDAMIGFACATVNGADTLNIVLAPAVVRDDTWAWATIGAPVYVSATPGAVTDEEPSGAGQFVRKIGYVLDADAIFFEGFGQVTVIPE